MIAELKLNNRQLSVDSTMPVWLPWLFVFTVFSREIGYYSLGGIDYDLIGYNFFIIYFLYRLRNFYISQSILIILFILIAVGIASKFYLQFQIAPLWKQVIPLAIIFLGTYDFFCRVSYKRLFEIYFKISYYASIFGLVQFFAKLFFNIKIMTDYGQLFVDSIAAEPSHFTVIILPAVIFGIFYFQKFKKETFILCLALLLTTSSTAYFVLLVMLLVIFRKFQYIILVVPLVYFIYTNVLLEYDKFSSRFLGFQNYFQSRDLNKVVTATSVSFLSNLEVAFESIKRNPLFGSGIGGHQEMYTEYFKESAFKFSYLYGLNSASGHSLLIRILSEAGIIGLFLTGWGIVKVTLLRADNYHRIISLACIAHFFGKALKLGGYFDYGTPFFAMILVFNYWDYKLSLKTSTTTQIASNE